MAKNRERGVAYIWYVEQSKTAKEIAQTLKVTEKTVGDWVKKFGWKKERNARENAVDKRIDNIKSVIDDITEDRSSSRVRLNELRNELLEQQKAKDTEEAQLTKELISDIKREIVGYDDAISKWNKTLENFDKENKVSLSNYLYVMDEIFKDLQGYDQKLYMKSLDFQEQHINKVSISIG